MQYEFMKTLSRLVCHCPAAARPLGGVVGQAAYLAVNKRRRRTAEDSIRRSLAVDAATARRIFRRSMTRFGPMLMEVLALPRLCRQGVRGVVRFAGEENLADALAEGKGVILATAHTGNWELQGAALAQSGFPLAVVVQRQKNTAMDRFINEYRTLAGMRVIYKRQVLEMVRALKSGQVLGLLMDQDAHEDGVFVDFFGRPASTPAGAAVLARLTGAPIVPSFITAHGYWRHTVIIHPPLHMKKTADKDADIWRVTQHLTKIIETHVRQYPEEWFWAHYRWKTSPQAVRNAAATTKDVVS